MKSRISIITISYILLLFNINLCYADVKLPKIFSSNMVLQQGIKIPVWGWADPGEKISVRINETTINTSADKDGKWNIKLPVQQYGGPFTLTVSGINSIRFENVMIGEVWICSGQSNMEMKVKSCNNADQEIDEARYPNIRLFTIPREMAQIPVENISRGEWVECTPENIADFSAAGYFFGRNIHQSLNVPVGLINASWGGTVAETWTSAETIKNDPDFSELLKELRAINLSEYETFKAKEIKNILDGDLPLKGENMVRQDSLWFLPEFDDINWKTIKTDKRWEAQGYPDINGIAWYRKEFILSENQTTENVILHLGKIEDRDIVWVNGHQIGETKQNINRIYPIINEYLLPGKNIFAVQVENLWGNGGFVGDISEQYLSVGEERIDLFGDWKFKVAVVNPSSLRLGPNSYPTLLYNSMIHPIIPFGIKGVIWYQGEGNAERSKQYRRIFPNMITDWRNHWMQGDFPFLFVSLANYNDPKPQPEESKWAELREAQTLALNLPNTGMALAIDIGEAKDIHPKNKQEVGRRLSLAGLKIAYNKNIVSSGPMFESVKKENQKIIVSFTETGSGLKAKDKYGHIKGFSIAGEDKKFYWAKAKIINEKQVAVWSELVDKPVAVRYGWADNPDDVNLYNKEGLPANPFRTDKWGWITE